MRVREKMKPVATALTEVVAEVLDPSHMEDFRGCGGRRQSETAMGQHTVSLLWPPWEQQTATQASVASQEHLCWPGGPTMPVMMALVVFQSNFSKSVAQC